MRSRLLVWLVVPLCCLCLGAGEDAGEGPKHAEAKRKPSTAEDRLWQEAEQLFDAQEYAKSLAAVEQLLGGKEVGELRRRQARCLGSLAAKSAADDLARAKRSVEGDDLRDALSKEQRRFEKRACELLVDDTEPIEDEDALEQLLAWMKDRAGRYEKAGRSFAAATWWLQASEYARALKLFGRALERAEGPRERLDCLAGLLQCQAGLDDFAAWRKTIEEMRKLMPALDEELRGALEPWFREIGTRLESIGR
jgi:hypothetical protein